MSVNLELLQSELHRLHERMKQHSNYAEDGCYTKLISSSLEKDFEYLYSKVTFLLENRNNP